MLETQRTQTTFLAFFSIMIDQRRFIMEVRALQGIAETARRIRGNGINVRAGAAAGMNITECNGVGMWLLE